MAGTFIYNKMSEFLHKSKRKNNPISWFMGIILCGILITPLLYPVNATGNAFTIGDIVLKTDQLRNSTGSDGSGIGVGVISNGVGGIEQAIQSGDLPSGVIVLKNGRGSEGTAMLEIIHDIAPGSSLLYHDFGGGPQDAFIQGIESLISAGARIIVDDVGFLQVPYFEDGYTATRLNQILSDHPEVMIITAAGNNAEAHYQGLFSDDGSGYHSFDGGTGIPVTIQPGGLFTAFLQWDDLYGQSGNDYNLYLEEGGQLIGLSERIQDGSSIPEEKFTYVNDGNTLVQGELRVKKASSDMQVKNIELFINAQPDKVYIDKKYLSNQDSIIGQAAVPSVISVAAISPEKVNSIEKYSSQGYVTVTYPQVSIRQKPDVTGINNIAVSGAGGFPKKFTGTSAAAPHIAGLLALEWSLFPTIPANQMRDALLTSTLELGESGWDSAFGYGLPDAMKMYTNLQEIALNNPLSSSLAQKRITTTEYQIDPPIMLSESGEITGPVIITKPGTYTLGKDISDYSGTIITILSSDVTIIGGGKKIEGISVQFIDNSPIDQNAILIQSPDSGKLKNIVIKDLAISGTTQAITGKQLDKLHIEGCTISYNTNGIGLFETDNGVIENCLLSGNSFKGLAIKEGSANNLVKGNTIEKNLYGIDTTGSINTKLEDNTIKDNRRADVYTPPDITPSVGPQTVATGPVPCQDVNFDGVCDNPNGTPKPTTVPATSSVPFSYSEEISMTTIYTEPYVYPYDEPYEEPHDDPYVEPYPDSYPTEYPTTYPTGCPGHCS